MSVLKYIYASLCDNEYAYAYKKVVTTNLICVQANAIYKPIAMCALITLTHLDRSQPTEEAFVEEEKSPHYQLSSSGKRNQKQGI